MGHTARQFEKDFTCKLVPRVAYVYLPGTVWGVQSASSIKTLSARKIVSRVLGYVTWNCMMCSACRFEEDVKCKLVSRVGHVTWNCMRRAVRQFDKDVKCTQASITSRICYIKPEAHNPKRITLSQCRRFLGNHSKFTFQYRITDERDCRASA